MSKTKYEDLPEDVQSKIAEINALLVTGISIMESPKDYTSKA